MKPDDITDEEYEAADRADSFGVEPECLAAQNALRDRRVREDERKRIARERDALDALVHDCLDVVMRLRARVEELEAELADERADRKAFHKHYVEAEADADALRGEHHG